MSDSYCPYCGSVSKTGDIFCQSCGASLDNNTSPSTPLQTQTAQPYPQPVQQQPFLGAAPSHQYGAATQTTYVQVGEHPTLRKNQAAELAVVFAILGFFIMPGLGGILAIIFGIVGALNPYKRSKAIIGIILGLCQTGGLLAMILFWFN